MALADLYSGPLYLGGNPDGDAADYFRKAGTLKPPTVLGRPAPSPVNATAPNVPAPTLGASTMLGGAPSTPQVRNPLQDQAPQPLTGKRKALAAIFAGMGAFKSPELGQQIYNEEFVAPQERYQKQEEQQQADIAKQREAASRESLQGAQAKEALARANALNNPAKDVKQDWRPVTGTNWEINSATGETRQMQGVPAPTKPAAKNPMSGTVNGKQAYAYPSPDGQGFVDANTGARLKNFVPAPSFAETGLFEQTTAFDPKSGTMVPARFDRRSGQIVGYGNEKNLVPISPEAGNQIGKSLEAAREADTRLETMQQNYKDGLNGDQQAMLSLLANHIGMTLGLQKGARITQAIYEEAMQSAPWLARVKSKFDKDGYLTGVTLTPEQMNQMMQLADQKRGYLWEQAQQTGANYGVPLNVAPMQRRTPQGGGTQGGNAAPPSGVVIPKGWRWQQQDGKWGITDGRNFRPYVGNQ